MRRREAAVLVCLMCGMDRPAIGRCAYIRGVPGGAPRDHCLRCCRIHKPHWAWRTWRVWYPKKWRGNDAARQAQAAGSSPPSMRYSGPFDREAVDKSE